MKAKQLAEVLNGGEYRKEISKDLEAQAKAAGLVVVFGASDDLMEFRGAINDELSAYEGTTAYVTSAGLLQNDCDSEDCPHFVRLQQSATPIRAIWDSEGYSWTFETSIPHHTFEIIEDGEKYCRGIVFALSGVPS